MSQAQAPIRFAADVAGVREVSIHGTADLAYWRKQLAPEGLDPFERDGQACVSPRACPATHLNALKAEVGNSA